MPTFKLSKLGPTSQLRRDHVGAQRIPINAKRHTWKTLFD